MEAEDFAAYVEQVHAKLEKVGDSLSEGEFTGLSDDERIVVRVNAQGHLIGLEIDPRVYRRPDSEGLAAAILKAADRARAASVARTQELFGQVLGMDVDPDAWSSGDVGDLARRIGSTLRRRAEEEGR